MSAASTRIDAEARGRLRVWKMAAAKRWNRFNTLCHTREMVMAAIDLALRSTRDGRARAFAKLRRGFAAQAVLEGVRLDGAAPLAVWSILKPRDAVIVASDDPSLQQDCVTVNYLIAGKLPGGTHAMGDGLWTLEVSDHALGRLLQRDRGVELDGVLFAAHHALLRTRTTLVAACFPDPERSFLVPAGDGVFVCTMRSGRDVSRARTLMVHCRAVTWLHRDQLSDSQDGRVIVDDGAPGERLGDTHFLPAPLRRYTELGGNVVAVGVWAPGLPETLATTRRGQA